MREPLAPSSSTSGAAPVQRLNNHRTPHQAGLVLKESSSKPVVGRAIDRDGWHGRTSVSPCTGCAVTMMPGGPPRCLELRPGDATARTNFGAALRALAALRASDDKNHRRNKLLR